MFYKWVIIFCLLPHYLAAQESVSPMLYQENGLWGLKEDKPLTPAVYDTLIPIKNGSYFIAKKHKSRTYINSTGVISSKGKSIIPFNYLEITETGSNYVVKKWENGTVKTGVVSQSNSVILNVRFKMIQSVSKHWIVQSFTDEIYIYNLDGSILKQINADSVSLSPDSHFIYTFKGSKIGLVDYNGNILFAPKFKTIVLKNGNWKTTAFNQWRIISSSDTITIYADSTQIWDSQTFILGINSNYQISTLNERVGKPYKSIQITAPSLAITKKLNLYGAIHKNGDQIIAPIFNKIYFFKGYFYAYKNHHWALYDSLGNKKSVLKYDSIGSVNDGLFPIYRKGKWGFMNRNGKEIIHCIYDSPAHFEKGKAIISYFGAMGIIDPKGDWIVKPNYKEITDYSFNFYIYKINNLYYLKNYAGELIYFSPHQLIFKDETIYEIRDQNKNEITSLGTKAKNNSKVSKKNNSWHIIKIAAKYGFVDTNGLLKITYRYDSLMPYSEGLAAFRLRNKWGFINVDEQIIIQPHFSEVTSFKSGISIITKNNKKGLINSKGKYILTPKYDSITILKDNIWLVKLKGLSGLFKSNGNIIIQPKYNLIEFINDKLIIINSNKKYGAFDINGTSILPRVYNYIGYNYENKILLLKKGM